MAVTSLNVLACLLHSDWPASIISQSKETEMDIMTSMTEALVRAQDHVIALEKQASEDNHRIDKLVLAVDHLEKKAELDYKQSQDRFKRNEDLMDAMTRQADIIVKIVCPSLVESGDYAADKDISNPKSTENDHGD